MPQDETVYTIIAGYVPTVGYKRDDFAMDSKHGKPMKLSNGQTRYHGTTLNYGFGLAKDGSVRKLSARIPGSIAWFEYSTSVRAVRTALSRDEDMQEVAGMLADNWYRRGTNTFERFKETGKKKGERGNFPNFNKEQANADIMQDVLADLDIDPSWHHDDPLPPNATEVFSSDEETIAGTSGFVSRKPRPEERDPLTGGGDMQGEAYMASDAGLVGQARAVDVYMRNLRGEVVRLDVTERSLDDRGGRSALTGGPMKGAHHGLGDIDERTAAGVTSMQLLAMSEDDAYRTLHTYFSGKVPEWNAPIENLVNMVATHGSQRARQAIDSLRTGHGTLNRMTGDIQRALLEMRGGAGPAGSGTDERGSIRQAVSSLRRHTAKNAWRAVAPTKNMTNYRAFESAVAFALHALGNIVRDFTTPGQVQGQYVTGYQLGNQGKGQDYVVGVLHRVFASGQRVFQFMPLREGDVILANEARLTHHFMRENWFETGRNVQDAISTGVRQQNLVDAASMADTTTDAVRTNTIYNMGQVDAAGTMRVIHEGKMLIAPEHVNADIEAFMESLTTNAGKTGMHRFLKNKIRQVASFSSPGRKGNIDRRTANIGGPMMTANLADSINREALQMEADVGDGEYADWLALSGAFDLSPLQATDRGAGTFAYDMMGHEGRLGSSGARASMGYGAGSAGHDPSDIMEGSWDRSTMSLDVLQNFTNIRQNMGMRNVTDMAGQDVLDSEGRPTFRFQGQGAEDAHKLLKRGLGGSAPGTKGHRMANIARFLSGDAADRSMGASMGKSQNWQEWARSMAPKHKGSGNIGAYAEGEYEAKSRQSGWGTPGVPQLWAAPYVGVYYPAKRARSVQK